jgi:hypothetical protein
MAVRLAVQVAAWVAALPEPEPQQGWRCLSW